MARTTSVWLSDEILARLAEAGLTPIQAIRRGVGLDGEMTESVVLKRLARIEALLQESAVTQTAPESTLPLAGFSGIALPAPPRVLPPASGSASQHSPFASFDPDEDFPQ